VHKDHPDPMLIARTCDLEEHLSSIILSTLDRPAEVE
jgi:hypothetical protein